MLARMHIEHEVDQRSFESGAQTDVNSKSCAGDLRRTLHVEDAEFRPQIPMRFRLEVERARLPPAADLDVVLFRLPDRHGFVRRVRNARELFPERLVELSHTFVEFGDPFAGLADLRLPRGRVLTGLASRRNFLWPDCGQPSVARSR